MTILFRCDASFSIGSGHVIRCRTLARQLQTYNHKIVFVCRQQPGDLISLLEEEFQVLSLPPLPLASCKNLSGRSLYEAWLGCTQEEDASDFLDCINTNGIIDFDWLVVDHYGLDIVWETRILSSTNKCEHHLFVIDDLADRNHIANLLLDQNFFGDSTSSRYHDLVPVTCRTLLGPDYSLLSPEYSLLHPLTVERIELRRILIYFGGVDQFNLTLLCLQALNHPSLSHLQLDVVLGSQSSNYQAVADLISTRPYSRLYTSLDSLASLISQVDLSIGAGGTTTWERSCLKLPSLVISVASNQVSFSQLLHKHGHIRYLGDAKQISYKSIQNSILSCLTDFDSFKRVSSLTDGYGVSRVIASMFPFSSSNLYFRKFKPYDSQYLARLKAHFSSLTTISALNKLSSLTSPALPATPNSPHGDNANFAITLPDKCPIGYFHIDQNNSTTYRDSNLLTLSYFIDKAILSSHLTYSLFLKYIREFESRNCSNELSFGSSFYSLVNHLSSSDHSHGANSFPLPRITILSDKSSWINEFMPQFISGLVQRGYYIRFVHDPSHLSSGDVCFILSCSRILSDAQLSLHSHNLVVHESALPLGQGWSPMTWQILNGQHSIPITLFEATTELDAGSIYLQHYISLQGTELSNEWRSKQALSTIDICLEWLDRYSNIVDCASPQVGESTFYKRRDPTDSLIDPQLPLQDQFDLLRVVDNNSYPAFFTLRGSRFLLHIHKDNSLP